MISFEYLLEYFCAEDSAEILQTENIVISRLKIVILIFSIYGERPLSHKNDTIKLERNFNK